MISTGNKKTYNYRREITKKFKITREDDKFTHDHNFTGCASLPSKVVNFILLVNVEI